jgi:hypothetical protein
MRAKGGTARQRLLGRRLLHHARRYFASLLCLALLWRPIAAAAAVPPA